MYACSFSCRSSSLCAQNRELARIGSNTFESESLAQLITQSEINVQKSAVRRFFYVMFSRRSHASWWHQYTTIIQREWRVEPGLFFQVGHRAVQHALRCSAVPRRLHRALHRADVPQSPNGSSSEPADVLQKKGIRSRVSVMSFALMNECYAALFSESSIFDSYMQIIFTESQNGEE